MTRRTARASTSTRPQMAHYIRGPALHHRPQMSRAGGPVQALQLGGRPAEPPSRADGPGSGVGVTDRLALHAHARLHGSRIADSLVAGRWAFRGLGLVFYRPQAPPPQPNTGFAVYLSQSSI
jgi:hypothetical protein